MSTEPVNNNSVESSPVDDSDLDSFSTDFFGQKTVEPEPASSEEPEENADATADRDATEDNQEDTQEAEEDVKSDEADDPEDAPEEKPKGKNRAQERISELNAKWREEQRRAAELEAKLAALQNPTPKNIPEPTSNGAPNSDDLKEDGTPKYPLGDFDPAFMRDLAAYTAKEQFEQYIKQQEEQKQAQAKEQEKSALVDSWNERLNPALERYPDFQEKAVELFESLSDIDPDYEDYISATIMQLDYGPDVLYYLSSNPDEARAIINSGPVKSAVLLGRLESKFAVAEAEKTLARPKISKAPTPPPTNKGTSISRGSVAPDTDDLEAFEKVFNVRKK